MGVGVHPTVGVAPGQSMISDIDIYRSAKLLIDCHGKDAPIHAAKRADELLVAGDMDGARAWKRIIGAIDTLLSDKPGKGARVH